MPTNALPARRRIGLSQALSIMAEMMKEEASNPRTHIEAACATLHGVEGARDAVGAALCLPELDGDRVPSQFRRGPLVVGSVRARVGADADVTIGEGGEGRRRRGEEG